MSTIVSGKEHDYFWIQALDVTAIEVVSRVPSILTGRQLVIVSIDGEYIEVTKEERELGFTSHGGKMISPHTIELSKLPEGGANEWYFFNRPIPAEINTIRSFASLCPFHFAKDERISDIQKQFWSQLNCVHPESYLCDTNLLLFATVNHGFHECVMNALNELQP